MIACNEASSNAGLNVAGCCRTGGGGVGGVAGGLAAKANASRSLMGRDIAKRRRNWRLLLRTGLLRTDCRKVPGRNWSSRPRRRPNSTRPDRHGQEEGCAMPAFSSSRMKFYVSIRSSSTPTSPRYETCSRHDVHVGAPKNGILPRSAILVRTVAVLAVRWRSNEVLSTHYSGHRYATTVSRSCGTMQVPELNPRHMDFQSPPLLRNSR